MTHTHRFGGPETYRRTVSLFVELAWSDVTMMLFWLIVYAWQGRTDHLLMMQY